MTSISRPSLFAPMGPAFIAAFGNADVTLTIDGVAQTAVRGILRQVREIDLATESLAQIEGVTHQLSLDAGPSATVESGRDTAEIGGVSYGIRAVADDGRAMLSLFLQGDI